MQRSTTKGPYDKAKSKGKGQYLKNQRYTAAPPRRCVGPVVVPHDSGGVKVDMPPRRSEKSPCTCWGSPKGKIKPVWLPPQEWEYSLFGSLSNTAAMEGAEACVCAAQIVPGEYRAMHFSLCNGRLKVDVPVLEDGPAGGAPVYTKHVFCCSCGRFKKKYISSQKPPSPIVWSKCEKCA